MLANYGYKDGSGDYFIVLDTDRCCVSIRRIPYDVAAAQRKIRQAGLPAFLAGRLAIGR